MAFETLRLRGPRRFATLLSGLGLAAALAIPAAAASAAISPPPENFTPTVNAALTETFATYGNTAGRWTGADSAYSVPLPDGSTAWLYSDTFLGTVEPDNSRPITSPFIHNSIIVDKGGVLTTYTGGTEAAPDSLVNVVGGVAGQNWYWFGDGTVEGDQLRVMLLEFERTGGGIFDFGFVRTAIATFSLADMSLVGITSMPEGVVSWASAIYEDTDFTYVYGVEDLGAQKYMHLARVPSGQITATPWEFLGVSGWTSVEADSSRMMLGVSNEYSVTAFRGGFALVTGDANVPLSSEVLMYTSGSLTGPFENPTVIYTTPETGGNVFTYNSKAHPQLGSDDKLVISYNVNSFNTDDVYTDVDNYRPRYVDIAITPAANPGPTVVDRPVATLPATGAEPVPLFGLVLLLTFVGAGFVVFRRLARRSSAAQG